MNGIECFLHREILNDDGQGHVDYSYFVEMGGRCDLCEAAVVYRKPEAEALEAVIAAARAWKVALTKGDA